MHYSIAPENPSPFAWPHTDTNCLFSIQALDKLSVCRTPLSRSGATPTLSCLWALTYHSVAR